MLSKRTPPTLKEQQEFLIETLPSVGAGLAKALLKKFKSVQGVLTASEKDLLEVDKIGKTKAKTIRNVIESKYKG